jgi:hypothetical protein
MGRASLRGKRVKRLAGLGLFLTAAFWAGNLAWAGQVENSEPAPVLPDSPQPQKPAHAVAPAPGPCQVKRAGGAAAGTAEPAAAAVVGKAAADTAAEVSGVPGPAADAGLQTGAEQVKCPPLLPHVNWYARFIDGPKVKPMTPKEKAWLAVRNVVDPFNGITILGSSAIAVGMNAHSAYGPGMTGFGRYVGVSYAQDMTGEFFGTFLIPSIVRQDPHYHRMPDATMKRRIAHAIYEVVWTQGDNGKGMVNYADVVGFAIDDEIGNLYVPGRQTDLSASAERYATGLATAPIDNFVSEFLPDVARHIHVQIVVIQRIINQVARTDVANGQP